MSTSRLVSSILIVLGAFLGSACADRDPETPPPPEPQSQTRTRVEGRATPEVRPLPPTPFDAAPVVFDTTEPETPVVRIPPRPQPVPLIPAPPRPPPAPRTGPSGSCDVRETEGYCFAYTGSGWTRRAAENNCNDAPSAAFSAGVCPTTKRIATCTFRRSGDAGREIVYTYYEPYDVALAELACPGVFERID